MKKNIILIIILAVLIGGGYWFWQKNENKKQNFVSDNTTEEERLESILVQTEEKKESQKVETPFAENREENQSVQAKTYNVSIKNFAFLSGNLTIKRGDTVIWTNFDSIGHTATGGSFDSKILNKGESFSFTFYSSGTFDYLCSPHPYMKGKIVVE
ncbi:cupredoxin family copper-binding protein [Candidatus Microgenomates bacterium]|nr:cupredoxin family copper-binding protein [Candidatus Microgenomates bacterium]